MNGTRFLLHDEQFLVLYKDNFYSKVLQKKMFCPLIYVKTRTTLENQKAFQLLLYLRIIKKKMTK